MILSKLAPIMQVDESNQYFTDGQNYYQLVQGQYYLVGTISVENTSIGATTTTANEVMSVNQLQQLFANTNIDKPSLAIAHENINNKVNNDKPTVDDDKRLKLQQIRDCINQNWTLYEVAMKATPIGWEQLFQQAEPELKHISGKIENPTIQYPYYPLKAEVFNAFYLVKPSDIKVVIVGQDCYPNMGKLGLPQATGMSFSVRMGEVIPPSLRNIFTEIERSVTGFTKPTHGDLTHWAKQGVFLLNQALTVVPQQANSHAGIWMGFLIKTINYIQSTNNKVIFVLWGREAQKLQKHIFSRSNILLSSHPSPLSVANFIGCNHFNLINEKLRSFGKSEIDWNVDIQLTKLI